MTHFEVGDPVKGVVRNGPAWGDFLGVVTVAPRGERGTPGRVVKVKVLVALDGPGMEGVIGLDVWCFVGEISSL